MRRRFFTELNTNKYFNIEILGDGDINFKFDMVNNEYYNLLKYSKNNIKNWKSIQVETFPIELSDIIYFKCKKWEIRRTALYVETPCKIKGNPLSLCGYTPNTGANGTNFDSFLSKINVIEIDDSFWRNISMYHDLYAGLFAGNKYITSINIPDYITNIPSGFFSNCSNLANIIIPNSVTTIGDEAFYGCSSLTSVNIPNSVTTIEGCAFKGCSSLTSITIPNSVTKIGDEAFYGCSSLKSITIPNSVTSIKSSAFEDCSSLKSITIPNSIISIGWEAFRSCTSLTSIIIPESVTSIGNWAFINCNSLTSVYCKAKTPPALNNTNVFDYNGSGRKIYVPAGSVNAYKSASGWSEYADAIVGYDFEDNVAVE